ncbi:MAG: Ig-like domain-containing protein, partial [Candidatus Paceibacterota bacterium]
PVDSSVTTDTTPNLTWIDLGGDETDYEVQVDDNADFSSVHAGGGTTGSGATVTFTVDSALTDDTLYYWRVRGIDGNGNGTWSVVSSFYVNAGWNTMAAPTLANTAMTSPVTVSWTAETGAVAYKVYRKSASPVAITDTYVGTTLVNSFIDYPTDGSWYYGVVPVDGSNANGTISTTSAVVTTDTTAPTDVSVSIAGGAEYSIASSTTITVAANGVTNMQFSCDGDNYTVAEAYATTKTFNLRTETGAGCTDADGSKVVYVKMLDASGNYTIASDEIVLDTTVPDVSGASVTVSVSGGQVTVTWTAATDATAGVDSYAVYRKTSSPVATSDTKVVSGLTAVGFVDAFSADGTYYYGITATDKAGNTSVISTTSAVATVDVTGPTPVSIVINSNALTSTSATLTLTLFADGSPSTMAFSCDGSTYAVAEAYATSKSLVLASYGGGCTATDGLKVVYVKMLDTNSNATYAFDYITLDATAPTVSAQTPLNGATDVAIATAPTVTFDSDMDSSTISFATVQLRKYSDDSVVASSISYDATTKVATITPVTLANSTQYYIWVSGAKDIAGNTVTAYTTKADQDFTTVSAGTGSLAVTGIYQTRSYGTADASWGNGWQWIINATIPTDELSVALKFTDWTGVGSATLATASNMRYYCAQSDYADSSNAVTVTAAATYATAMTISAASDLDTATAGIQVQIYVETKIPAATTAGSYSTSYGLQSS